MPPSCHGAIAQVRRGTDLTVALAGNPNVGKSSLFNQLTGLEAITANYPGKTVEVNVGQAKVDDTRVALIDLPGTYSLGGVSEDQWVARRAVLDGQPDAVLGVVDATNLARNLYLMLQIMDLGLPVALALNLVDEAERHGRPVDAPRLASLLGVPVVPTVATKGRGLAEAMAAALALARERIRQAPPTYGAPLDSAIANLAREIEEATTDALPYGLGGRALAVLLLEEDADIMAEIRSRPDGAAVVEAAERAADRVSQATGERASILVARRRHALAARIASQVVARPGSLGANRFLQITTSLSTGVPILVVVLGLTFAFLFSAGQVLSELVAGVWHATASPLLHSAVGLVLGEGAVARTLLWGVDGGILAALSVGIPYVLTFYFLLALLEDSGYLSSVAFLGDQVMRKLGLHGRAIIPLVAGAGCNVPAIIGTRVLSTMRERTIASTLIVLIPCSARTAVILGAVSLFVGWQAALGLFGIVAAVIVVAGVALGRLMPGETGSFVVEMFPFRWPHLATTAKKTWGRFKEFLFVALPIVVVGSIALGALYETGAMWLLAAPLSPVVEGWLGLPAVAGLTLIFAVLRKELALQLLVALAIARYGQGSDNLLSFLTRQQIFVYALVNTLYIPCVATISVLGKELGWKRATAISVSTVAIALIVAGVAGRIVGALGWL